MGTLLASVIPLALGAAVSPTVLTAQLLLLSRKEAPIKRSAVALLGSGLVLLGYTAIALLAGIGTNSASSPSTVDGIVKLVFALLLLGLGVRAALKEPKAASKTERPDGGTHLIRSFELGAAMMLVNFTTLALYFPALHEITASDVSSSDELVAILVVFLITMIPAYMPLLLTLLFGDRARRALGRLNAFLGRHQQGITVGICFLFAAYLGVSGLKILL